MSGHSSSSRHRGKSSKVTDADSEALIAQVKDTIAILYEVMSSDSCEDRAYIPSAQSAMRTLDYIRFLRSPNRLAEQIWIIQGLQHFACHDADNGCIVDIAEYCQAAWLLLLRSHPENVDVLIGLGWNWLQRSQSKLARIQSEEAYHSNGGISSNGYHSQAAQNDPRRQGQLYIEARGYLQPAVDFYSRAIRSADHNNTITGELLASAAESYMSLGNVTDSPQDEELFTKALRYLRRAEAIPGYALGVYLQHYLNDYGRFIS